jgi:hypothetical protein
MRSKPSCAMLERGVASVVSAAFLQTRPPESPYYANLTPKTFDDKLCSWSGNACEHAAGVCSRDRRCMQSTKLHWMRRPAGSDTGTTATVPEVLSFDAAMKAYKS